MDLIVCFTIGIIILSMGVIILSIGVGFILCRVGFATKKDIMLTKPMIYGGIALIMFSVLMERIFK